MDTVVKVIGRRRWSVGVAALVVALGATGTAAAKPHSQPPSYKVKMSFDSHRLWTYYYQQVSTDCVRTDDGNGSEDASFDPKAALFVLDAKGRGVAGFGVKGTDARNGTESHTVSGGECAASAVFPSTWSIIAEAAGTVTAAEPNTGCGPKRTTVSFPTLTLKGKTLSYEWDSNAAVPEFDPCPNFEGSNEAQPGHELPSSQYPDISAKVDRAALLAGEHRVTATGSVHIAETETCQNIVQGCPEGVTYNATGSLRAKAKFVFTRKG